MAQSKQKWKDQANADKKQIIDKTGVISTYIPDYSKETEIEFERLVSSLTDSPYFARVCKGEDDFYIGKEGLIQSLTGNPLNASSIINIKYMLGYRRRN